MKPASPNPKDEPNELIRFAKLVKLMRESQRRLLTPGGNKSPVPLDQLRDYESRVDVAVEWVIERKTGQIADLALAVSQCRSLQKQWLEGARSSAHVRECRRVEHMIDVFLEEVLTASHAKQGRLFDTPAAVVSLYTPDRRKD